MSRAADEAYDAGARAGAAGPPLTTAQVTALALLLAPYRPAERSAA